MTQADKCSRMAREMARKDRILIVDDEQINLDFFEVMLGKLGFDVVSAHDGDEALEKVRESEPDLIILDNIMPKRTGWEVTRILKTSEEYSRWRDVPVIMFSAMNDVKDKVEGFSLGIEDYITKPFNFSEVLARIKAVLRSRDLTNQILHRERRIALVESLNKSLMYFASHLKTPVAEMLAAAESLNMADSASIRKFVDLVVRESRSTTAALEALQEEIAELSTKGEQIREQEVTLDDLEEKYQKHFEEYREHVEEA